MNKIKYFILLLALVATGMAASAQTTDEKIDQAVMKVYDKHIQQDPTNYAVYFQRANQNFNFGRLDAALADVSKAIELTPSDEKDYMITELLLRAKIYDKRNMLGEESVDLQKAQSMSAKQDLRLVDMSAKLALKRGDYETASKNFNAILRQSPQNFDAMYGLARTSVKQGKLSEANDYATRAVRLFPSEEQVYLNRADIYEQMGKNPEAIQDVIVAMSVASKESRSIEKLVSMSDKHYDEVMAGLQNAIDNAPKASLFYYLRYSIAMRHAHYGQALKEIKTIISNNFFDDSEIFTNEAQCQFQLCQYNEALASVNKALSMKGDDMEALVLKARIVQYQGTGDNYDAALSELIKAAAVNAADADMLKTQARLYIAKKKYDQALESLNKVLAVNAKDYEALLLRGWLYKECLNKQDAAKADFTAMLAADDNMYNLKGFALHELGRDTEARTWAEYIVSNNMLPGGEAFMMAAELMSYIGDNDKAVSYVESALANGYGSLFEINVNEEPYVNLSVLRRNAKFGSFVVDYPSNFVEKD